MANYEVHLDDAALYEMLNGSVSPIARLLQEISDLGAARARATVRVRHTPSRGARSTAFPPGYTRASIRTNVHHHNGLIYGGIAAEEEPTIFLEYPAEQMERQYPFLTTAFDSIYL